MTFLREMFVNLNASPKLGGTGNQDMGNQVPQITSQFGVLHFIFLATHSDVWVLHLVWGLHLFWWDFSIFTKHMLQPPDFSHEAYKWILPLWILFSCEQTEQSCSLALVLSAKWLQTQKCLAFNGRR